MRETKILVKTRSKTYPIFFGNNILQTIGKKIHTELPGTRKICIIVDKKVPTKFLKIIKKSLKKYEIKIFKLSVSEKIKQFAFANKIIETILKYNFNRSDCVISLGGGIVSDLSSFISNLTKRGLNFINVPTTLLAQVDASIGGKTSINSSQGKNLIGTFYQPNFVLIDLSVLKSLPKKEFVCGYGEILKHSLIADKNFFKWLLKYGKEIVFKKNNKYLQQAVVRSCKIKSDVVSKDEKEKNLRMILNFGHTFAHGFEATRNFSRKLNHGEAVLLGMIMASELSYNKKQLSFKDLSLIKKHYIELKLPMKINNFFNKSEINKIIYFMKKDKKNLNQNINLILIKKIGKVIMPNKFNIKEKELQKFLTKQYG